VRTAEYQPSLDGLRAIAALAVVLGHCKVPFFEIGGRGVHVFFVLSGYLITTLIKREMEAGTFAVTRFWWNRFVRLVPALALVVAAYLLVGPFLWQSEDQPREALHAITYTMNFSLMADPRRTALDHTWSLAMEEQFYLLWPFLLATVLTKKRPAIVLVYAWLAITALRFAVVDIFPFWGVYYSPIFGMAGLVLGSALALARIPSWVPAWIGLPSAALLALLLSVGTIEAHWWTWAGYKTAIELTTAALIVGMQKPSWAQRALAWEPLRLLGLISYGIYLWHYPIVTMMLSSPWPVKIVTALGLSIPLAALSYIFVERPIRQRWRMAASRPATV